MSQLQESELHASDASPTQENGIDILDVLLVLVRDRRRIAVVTVASLLLGGAVSFLLLKPTFTASASILPPQQQQSSASAMLGQLGSLAGFGGGAAGLLKSPADMYVSMMTSRTVIDQVIERFRLQALYKTKSMDATRKSLRAQITIEAGKDGLIQITVKDSDPRRASNLANALIEGLYNLTSGLAITEASQRRLFFDQQLNAEKVALAAAEDDLKKTQEKTGLIQIAPQAEEIIRNVGSLRAEIVSREVEMQAMRTYATDQNPGMTRLQQEIAALQQQLAALESNQSKTQPGDIQVPTGQVPAAGLEYARKLREVSYHTSLLTILAKEYEAARIDEAKSSPLIQVVDRAVPPDRKSGPPRALLTVAAGLVGFMAASIWALGRQALKRIRRIPENAERIDQLRSEWHRRESRAKI